MPVGAGFESEEVEFGSVFIGYMYDEMTLFEFGYDNTARFWNSRHALLSRQDFGLT